MDIKYSMETTGNSGSALTRHSVNRRSWFPVIAIGVSVFFFSSQDADAQLVWPQFRGPTGQGIAESHSLPVEWAPDRNIVWRTEVPGVGWSSPAIANDHVFITTAVPSGEGRSADHSLRAVCLAANSGEVVWDVEVFLENGKTSPRIHGKNSHASPTPVVDEEFVYVHFGHMGTACLRQDNGKVLWSTQQHSYKPTHGNGGSPVLWNDLLLFSIDGSDQQAVIALNKQNGNVAWQTPREVPDLPKYFSFSTPLLIEVNGKTQLISAGSGVVMALKPSDGSEIWRVDYGRGYSVVPRPVYANGMVYVCTGYDRSTLLAIRPDGRGNVTDSKVAFSADRNVPYNPSLLAVDNVVYMVSDNGILTCLDGANGDVIWRNRVGGNFSASPLFANGHIYLFDESGKATVVKHAESYELVAENDLKERTLASLGVDQNALILRTEQAIYRIESGK